MCGIAGGIALAADSRPDPAMVSAMSSRLTHRGPDDSGLWTAPSGRAVFAHRRLSVIDLSEGGSQPMVDETGSIGIVFNGEIYNYLELQQDLETEGVHCKSRSDTEVLMRIVARTEEEGLDCLRGMFAFALWNDVTGTAILARDRIGKKPLFYTILNGCLYFCSSLSALRREVPADTSMNIEALDLYLSLGYIPAPFTIYKGISRLPAASFAKARNGAVRVRRYWDLAVLGEPYQGSYASAKDELEEKLDQAVAIRLRSDVPIGVFLSGGIDSSLITALSVRQSKSKVQTFCIGLKGSGSDESPSAAAVAHHLGTAHHTLHAESGLLDTVPEMSEHFGEPYGDASALALWAIAKMARPHITVALGGDGGDEGFAGYDWYANASRLTQVGALMPQMAMSAAARMARFAAGLSPNRRIGKAARAFAALKLPPANGFAALRSFISDADAELLYAGSLLDHRRRLAAANQLLSVSYSRAQGSALRKMRYADIETYLADDLSPKIDVATMAHGLEARAPLLDQEVMKFALSLPDHFLTDGFGGKRILRDLLARHLPVELFMRPKQGFSLPLAQWLTTTLAPKVAALEKSEALLDLQVLNPSGIRRLFKQHESGFRDHSQRLFNILQLDAWLSNG
ncbi:asparagine synthase (glutamine-hydrolyzing) [Aminobacter anthyllidis]|uniref:asparagine synthase (glutamine-hydrolyzing) n=1 Tax=Aminobacter anthyllidis TaxID=1035067 RepID=A0A9X1AGD8_9HYPH|nr:asparagine synthase (glutamine-hydrolyzing) [Aminobacter anthyllidis]MBT1159342.1 asparagine synthase (glutamine-hydrolyzing) [Aminobacter anthyllidis]